MRKNLTKIVIILGLIIINLFFCSFSNIVFAGTYSEEDNTITLKKLNGEVVDNTVDILQYAASNRQEAFFEFNAGDMIRQNKEMNIRDGEFDNYETSNPGVICLSPGNHIWAKTQRVDCIMDINVDGVTVYTPTNPNGKEFSRDSKNANVVKAIELADQLAYFAYMSVKNKETTQNEPWHYYKSIMRFQIFGHNSTLFSETLGIPKVFVPHNMVDAAGDFYQEKLKEWKKATDTYQYTGRFVFLNGTLLANNYNGQNDCIYSGQQRTKTSLKIKKVDPEGNPLKGVEIRIYESSSKKEKGDWLFTGVTNKNGVVNFSGEKGKWYYVREYKTISGYVKADPDHQVVKLTTDKQPVKFVNERKVSLKIVKKDQYGNTVDGIKFRIFRVENDGSKTYVGAKRTKNGGVIDYKDAEIGETYYIEEDVEDSKELGYEPDGKTSETIKIGEGVNKVYFKNKLTKPKVLIIKQDSETGKVLPDATFEIIDENRNIVATGTTNDEGELYVLIEKEGIGKTYYVKEVDPPPNYYPSNEGYKEVILKEGVNPVVFKNDPITQPPGEDPNPLGNLNICKIDSEDEDYNLSGVEFKVSVTSNSNRYENKYIQLTNASGHVYSGESVGSSATIDEHNNANGSKYHIEYVSDANQATIFTTSKDGKISIKNLQMYNDENNKYVYTLEEVTNTNYGYRQEVENQDIVELNNGSGVTQIENEQQLGRLVIHKVDQGVWDEHNEKIGLEGVEFKIRISESEYLQLSSSNGVEKEIKGKAVIDEHNEVAEYGRYIVKYVSKEEATTFITDKNGIIRVENLEVWKNPKEKYTYYMDEIAIGEKWELYYDIKTEEEAKDDYTTLYDQGDTDKTIYNKQKYVDLAGYIWDDGHQGKNTVTDSYYKEGSADKRIYKDDLPSGKKGITIRLMQGDKPLAIAEANKDAKPGEYMDIEDEIDGKIKRDYFFPSQMKPSDSSKGITWVNPEGYKIEIGRLSEYYIEFYYNGLKYQSVPAVGNKEEYHKADNSSKAEDKNRDTINNNFYSIKGGNVKTDTTQGSTSTEVGLTYKSGTGSEVYTSTLVQNTKYTKESLGGSVSDIDRATSTASTKDYYKIKFIPRRDKIRKTIEYINLGIYEREQADLAVASDLYNIQMEINGYVHTYNYKKRKPYLDYGIQDHDYEKIDGADGYKAIMDAFSVQAKNDFNDNYRNLSYVREIFPSYIAYTKEDPGNENRLRVFVNYELIIKNQSTLDNKVRLRNYFETQYKFVKASEGSWTCDDIKEGDVKICEMAEEIDVGGGQNKKITLTFELDTEAIIALANGNGIKTTKINTTEIISYSTYKDGKNYASIDKDSAPDNTRYGDKTTYEDDVDAAPPLTIKRDKENKVLTGTVFEDDIVTGGTRKKEPDKLIKTQEEANKNVTTGKYEGNGKYEDKEGRGKDVYVELVKREIDQDGNYREVFATLYDLDESGNVIHDESDKTTEEDGKYKFNGLIPGIYYIRYTYGTDGEDKKTIIKPIEGTGKTDTVVTTQDHKSTIIKDENPAKNAIRNQYKGSDDNYTWKNIEDEELKLQGSDGYWYEAKGADIYSSAVDDYNHRKAINKALEHNKYQVKTDYDERNDFEGLETSIYLMTSRTPLICIAIEDQDKNDSSTRKVEDIDGTPQYDANKDKNNKDENSNDRLPTKYETKFGIVERPRQNFEVTKEVSYIKVTLANGQILLEGDPRNLSISNYLTYPEGGMLKIEIDNEIIEGAKLETTYDINVANLSDLNYDIFDYYIFAKDNNKPVETSIRWIDYMDKELALVDNSWKIYDSKIIRAGGYLEETTSQNNNYNYIVSNGEGGAEFGNGENYYYTKTVAPGKVVNTPINASKLLSTAKDMTYDNKVEFLNVYNSVGRFYQSTVGKDVSGVYVHGTPGNNKFDTDNPNSEDKKDPDNNSKEPLRAEIVIVPPTGQARIYYAIGITCLTLLVGGIVLIKKKVLDK